MFRFANIEFLWLLWLIAFFVLLFVLYAYLTKKNLKKFGDSSLIYKLMPETSFKKKVLKFVLFCFIYASVVLAIARPQFLTGEKEVVGEGVELAIVLDVSNSMLAQDIKPNRLQYSVTFINRVLRRLDEDKLALVVFAGDAFVQMPMTSDINVARMFLPVINTDMVPVQGTAIGNAIETASRTFTANPDVSKLMLIISDGEDHEDDPVTAAEYAAENNITIHTVGMGLPEGAPIPLETGGFLRDRDGNVVTTALDENTLKKIASAGNGIYVRAGNNPNSLDAIIEEIDKAKTEIKSKTKYKDFEEQFQYFIGLAILLIIINFFISERKNRLLNKMDIFKTQ